MKSNDMFKFMLTSLKTATIGFKCSVSKGYLDHILVQNHVYNGTFGPWIEEKKEILHEYVILRNVVSLRELYFKAKSTFISISSTLVVDNSLTLSQMSMNAFKTSLLNIQKDSNISTSIKLPIKNECHFDNQVETTLYSNFNC